MAAKTLSKQQFNALVDRLIGGGRVIGVRRQENKFAFGNLASSDELVLDYDVTLRSPKVFFQPPKEKLLEFKTDGKTKLEESREKPQPFVLLGVHTYDLKALNQMDSIWAKDNEDEHYLARRAAATVIALEPTKASKWSFWAWMDGTTIDGGYDLLLTDIGEGYVIEIGTKEGEKLLKKHAPEARDASSDDLAARDRVRKALPTLCNGDREVKVPAREIPNFIRNSVEHPIWEKQAEKCYSCGSCNLVCPTCYCFDVKDSLELDLKSGERNRQWDGCLLESFAVVGSGENFREKRADRFRHRIFRKAVYMYDKLGELACVGCGRCSEACLPDITDPVKIINTIKEGN